MIGMRIGAGGPQDPRGSELGARIADRSWGPASELGGPRNRMRGGPVGPDGGARHADRGGTIRGTGWVARRSEPGWKGSARI